MYQISPVFRCDRDRLAGLARTHDDLAEVVGEANRRRRRGEHVVVRAVTDCGMLGELVERGQLAPVAQAR